MGIVFTLYLPGSPDNGKRVELSWCHKPTLVNSGSGESVGICDSIRIAGYQLRAIAMALEALLNQNLKDPEQAVAVDSMTPTVSPASASTSTPSNSLAGPVTQPSPVDEPPPWLEDIASSIQSAVHDLYSPAATADGQNAAQAVQKRRYQAEVHIWSDSVYEQERLELFKKQPNGAPEQSLVDKVHARNVDESHELGNIPGMDVKLFIHWAPGHTECLIEHERADEIAGEARKSGRSTCRVGGVERPHDDPTSPAGIMMASIYDDLKGDFKAEGDLCKKTQDARPARRMRQPVRQAAPLSSMTKAPSLVKQQAESEGFESDECPDLVRVDTEAEVLKMAERSRNRAAMPLDEHVSMSLNVHPTAHNESASSLVHAPLVNTKESPETRSDYGLRERQVPIEAEGSDGMEVDKNVSSACNGKNQQAPAKPADFGNEAIQTTAAQDNESSPPGDAAHSPVDSAPAIGSPVSGAADVASTNVTGCEATTAGLSHNHDDREEDFDTPVKQQMEVSDTDNDGHHLTMDSHEEEDTEQQPAWDLEQIDLVRQAVLSTWGEEMVQNRRVFVNGGATTDYLLNEPTSPWLDQEDQDETKEVDVSEVDSGLSNMPSWTFEELHELRSKVLNSWTSDMTDGGVFVNDGLHTDILLSEVLKEEAETLTDQAEILTDEDTMHNLPLSPESPLH